MVTVLVLSLLAWSSLGAQSDSSAQQQGGNPNPTPPQASEPSSAAQADSTGAEVIKKAVADYPIQAQRDGIQGQVLVKVFISEAGDVERAEIVSGDKVLAGAARDAAKKWKFKPFIKGGKPVKVATTIPFNFAFSDKITDTRVPANLPATENGDVTKRVRISQGVSTGLLIHKVIPVYPESARQNRVQGTVVLQASIGKDGRIVGLTPVSGPRELISAAIGAVQQWRYKPYLLQGEPVVVETQVVVNFQLH